MEKNKKVCEADYGIENPKDIAIKIGVGIASIALIGSVVAAIILKNKKKEK